MGTPRDLRTPPAAGTPDGASTPTGARTPPQERQPQVLSLKEKLRRGFRNLVKITKGVRELADQGIPGKMLDEKYWREVADPKHRLGKGEFEKQWNQWRDSETSASFPEWHKANHGGMSLFQEEQFSALEKRFPIAGASPTAPVVRGRGAYKETYADSRIKYLTPSQRAAHEVHLSKEDNEVFLTHPDGRLLQTGLDWGKEHIFVLGPDKKLYVGLAEEGKFHHSSFFGGGAIIWGGSIETDEHGRLVEISNESGHYKPGPQEALHGLRLLQRQGINLNRVTYKDSSGHRISAQVYLERLEERSN
ncbi:MAG: hypothetical protein V4534_05715 [Myxococcota bacterium]